MLTISGLLARNARFRPEHPAFVFRDKRLTYKELNASVNQLAHAFLKTGLKKGDKVSTLLPNSAELYETYWACAKAGLVCLPNSPLLRGSGLVNLMNDGDTALIITCSSLVPFISEVMEQLDCRQIWLIDSEEENAVFKSYHQQKKIQPDSDPETGEIYPDDPYNIMYSSGTTGLPKGIVISHQVRALYGSLFANYFRMVPESVVMHSGSIVFNGSFLTLMPVMFVGATYILMDHFDANEVSRVIAEEKVTHTILVPSQIVSCLNTEGFNRENLKSLEYILSVGAPLMLEHKEELNRRAPGVFYELYGLTEGFMTVLDKNDFHKKAGSVGCVPQLMEMKIVDDEGREIPAGEIGEIIGRGPLLMSGYYKNPHQTADALREGWLYTGDLGFVDEDGYLFLTGRKKDLIISGGVNVYPLDIEEVIARHANVKDVAVFGIPHEEWGEAPVAAIILKNGSAESKEAILTFANSKLDARYQKLNDVMIVEDFPKNVAGKILKRELREIYMNTQ